MQINRLMAYNTMPMSLNNTQTKTNIHHNSTITNPDTQKVPVGFKYNANIHFGEFFNPNRTIPHIDFEEYKIMADHRKKMFRKKYDKYPNLAGVDANELVDKRYRYMPLKSEVTMDKFFEAASLYKKFKDQPIICLGRSPKWFLNAALWMKDGIEDYKFVAFSKYWYRPDRTEGVKLIEPMAPTEKEAAAYEKYLKRIKADPQTIVDNFKKTGKKTVITDYIDTGKGACSFLDIQSRIAQKAGILEDFSKSIEIFGIGSTEYICDRLKVDEVSRPSVPMPPLLKAFEKNIYQDYKDIDYNVFMDMLDNQNVNECRSTYYPHSAWTVYKPDQFKTGLISDMKKVKNMVKELKSSGEKSMSSFTPAMYDYRNLLNFRIIDALDKRGILKAVHKSKI